MTNNSENVLSINDKDSTKLSPLLVDILNTIYNMLLTKHFVCSTTVHVHTQKIISHSKLFKSARFLVKNFDNNYAVELWCDCETDSTACLGLKSVGLRLRDSVDNILHEMALNRDYHFDINLASERFCNEIEELFCH